MKTLISISAGILLVLGLIVYGLLVLIEWVFKTASERERNAAKSYENETWHSEKNTNQSSPS